jgi:hypothetical protein
VRIRKREAIFNTKVAFFNREEESVSHNGKGHPT